MAMMFEEQSAGICSSSLPPTADGVTSFQNPISPPPQANQRQFSSGESRSKKEDICFTCSKKGHWAKDCPMKSPNNRSPPPPQANQRQFASGESSSQKKKGVCFKCGKEEGHWAKECPMNSPNNRSPPLPPAANDFPIVHCICGVPCDVKVSRTQKNPGREFFTCSLPFAKKCGFFLWCKDAPKDENMKTPICGCGAGPCHIYKETSGQDAGRKFFVCPIKKGQGACSFVQPVDSINNLVNEQLLDSTNNATLDLLEDQLVDVTNDFWNEAPSSPPSTLTSCGDTSPSSIELVEEGNSSHQGMEIESPVVDTPEHSRKLGTDVDFSRTERGSLVDSQGLEDMSEEPLRKNCKRLRHGDLKIPCFVMDSVGDCLDMPQTKSTGLTMEKALRPSILSSGALICQRQVKFLRQISSAGASLPGGNAYIEDAPRQETRFGVSYSETRWERVSHETGSRSKGRRELTVFSGQSLQFFRSPSSFLAVGVVDSFQSESSSPFNQHPCRRLCLLLDFCSSSQSSSSSSLASSLILRWWWVVKEKRKTRGE